jgi:hypothetical protein
MHLCPKIAFVSIKKNSNELWLGFMEKKKQLYVLPTLIECHIATKSFDLWMSKVGHDIFW